MTTKDTCKLIYPNNLNWNNWGLGYSTTMIQLQCIKYENSRPSVIIVNKDLLYAMNHCPFCGNKLSTTSKQTLYTKENK
jgi:hypothetical protein